MNDLPPATRNAPGAVPITVLCVDDNPHVGEALRLKFLRTPEFEWLGWLAVADRLEEVVRARPPAIVVLDVDMPGPSPFAVLATLSRTDPQTRVIIFSGHVRPELVHRALEAGAWGYVSKNDGEEALLTAIREVTGPVAELGLSPEARSAYLLGTE